MLLIAVSREFWVILGARFLKQLPVLEPSLTRKFVHTFGDTVWGDLAAIMINIRRRPLTISPLLDHTPVQKFISIVYWAESWPLTLSNWWIQNACGMSPLRSFHHSWLIVILAYVLLDEVLSVNWLHKSQQVTMQLLVSIALIVLDLLEVVV